MFRTCLLLLFTFVLPFGLGAQTGAPAYFLLEAKQPVHGAALRSFAVQDLRPDTSQLGSRGRSWWMDAAPDRAVPFTRQLQYFGTTLLRDGTESADSLLMQLHALKVQLHEGIGCVFLDASLLVKRNGQVVRGFDTTLYQESVDTALHAALSHLFFQLIETAAAAPAVSQYDPGIPSSRAPAGLNPFGNLNQPRQGVYRSYADVLSNSPSDSFFVQVTVPNAGRNGAEFYRSNSRHRPGKRYQPGEFYAVYNGKTWFLSTPYGSVRIGQDSESAIVYCQLPGLALVAGSRDIAAHLTIRTMGKENAPEFLHKLDNPGPHLVKAPILYRAFVRQKDGVVIPIERVRE